MTPNPIRTVLSSIRGHGVRCLLMGGQACVFYGAAEFSRDTDLALLASKTNLDRFRAALAHLGAECIALPPSEFKAPPEAAAGRRRLWYSRAASQPPSGD